MKKPRSFRAANRRRCELISKSGDGLNAQEREELAALQHFCSEWVDARFPLPELPEIPEHLLI